jgi:hypothetical protein
LELLFHVDPRVAALANLRRRRRAVAAVAAVLTPGSRLGRLRGGVGDDARVVRVFRVGFRVGLRERKERNVGVAFGRASVAEL